MAMEIMSRESVKPSSPTPDHLRTFRLSLMDKFIPNFLYFSHILYYSHDDRTTSINIKQAEISPLLIRSLSDALALYYPFAGRVKCESSVDCNDQGVDFFETRVDAYLSDIIESGNSAEVLTKFVPTTSAESGGALLGIQLNYFNCGGIAIGVTLCHRIGDACTLSMFVKTWGSMARGDTNTAMAPSFVASTLFPPKEALGYQMQMTSEKSPEHWGHTRRFCFSSSKIAALRAAVESCTVVQVVAPTRVEVVTAAIWKWFMARKGRGRCVLSKAGHAVNIRRRMDPPLSEFVFGNLVVVVNASGNGEMELGELVSKMREATGKIDSEFLKELQGENGYDMAVRDIYKKMDESYSNKQMGYVVFSSWCNFPFYKTDFGWGKPGWVSMGARNLPNTVTFMDSVSDIGGIEAWIGMDEDCTYDEL